MMHSTFPAADQTAPHQPAPFQLYTATGPDAPVLDIMSRQVVWIARSETRRSIGAPSVWARWRKRVFGYDDTPRPLANPRLEMLRCFCILARVGDPQGAVIARTLIDKGHYTGAQLALAHCLGRSGDAPFADIAPCPLAGEAMAAIPALRPALQVAA